MEITGVVYRVEEQGFEKLVKNIPGKKYCLVCNNSVQLLKKLQG